MVPLGFLHPVAPHPLPPHVIELIEIAMKHLRTIGYDFKEVVDLLRIHWQKFSDHQKLQVLVKVRFSLLTRLLICILTDSLQASCMIGTWKSLHFQSVVTTNMMINLYIYALLRSSLQQIACRSSYAVRFKFTSHSLLSGILLRDEEKRYHRLIYTFIVQAPHFIPFLFSS